MAWWHGKSAVTNQGNRLLSVDALRGLAAMAVLLGHIRHHPPVVAINFRFLLFFPLDFGYLGVTLFLVISGFCIHLRPARRMAENGSLTNNWINFWRRRFRRLYPPYLVAIALSIPIFYFATPIARAPWQHIEALIPDLLTHLLMVHNLFLHFAGGLGNSSFWTLGLEEQLYALYAVYVVVRRRWTLLRTLGMVATVTLAWRVAAVCFRTLEFGNTPLEVGNWADWPFNYWYFWVLGAVAAEAHAGAITLPPWCYRLRSALVFTVAAVVVNPMVLIRLTGSNFIRAHLGDSVLLRGLDWVALLSDPLFACAVFVLLNTWVRSECQGMLLNPLMRAFSTAGIFSYSLYLTHIPILMLGETIHPTGDSVSSVVLRYLIYVPVCLAFAVIFFVSVERRFLHPARTNGEAR